jgi:hypothetical protein
MTTSSIPRKTSLNDLVSTRLQLSIGHCFQDVIRRQISLNTASYNNIYHNTYLNTNKTNAIVPSYIRM